MKTYNEAKNLYHHIRYIRIQLLLKKLIRHCIQTPYIKISGFQNTFHNNKNYETCIFDVFFNNQLPISWILKSIIYTTKHTSNVIVFLYLISHPVKQYCKLKLKEHFKNSLVCIT